MNNTSLIIITSMGIGVFFTTYIILILKILRGKVIKFSTGGQIKNSKIMNVLNRRRIQFLNWITTLTKREKYIIIASTFLFLGMSKTKNTAYVNLILGLTIGIGSVGIFTRIKQSMIRTKKIKEIVILFEGIEMYTKAGYSLIQAIKASKMLTTTINPSIDKCLNAWNKGPQNALEVLKNELNLEEADTLILLMMHLESAGSKNLKGMLKREALNINRIQRMKTELKIAHRPLILIIYKILPIASFIGIITGTLLFRVLYTFQNMAM